MSVNIISLNQIIDLFADFADRHFFINDFGYGAVSDIGTSRQMDFPYMWVTTTQDSVINPQNKTAIPELSFVVLFMDKTNIQDNYLETNGVDSNNVQEVLSDQLQILQDFITEVQVSFGNYGLSFVDVVRCYPAIDETQDSVNGWVGEFTLKIKHSNCILPTGDIVQTNLSPIHPMTRYLTCDTVTGCTSFQQYVANAISGVSGTVITGYTYNPNSNTFTIADNQGGSFNATITGMSGLTINGNLQATTISATTYQNLPLDIRVTGGTYSNGTATFTNNTGGTFNVTGFFTGSTDVFVTGGTYSNGTATFRNNTGGTFNVTGFSQTFTGGSSNCITDLYVSNIHGCSPITFYDSLRMSGSTASGVNSTAFGTTTKALGSFSHSEGFLTTAIGNGSHVEGVGSTSIGQSSHSEGDGTTAIGDSSHSEGTLTTASGNYSHAEGQQTRSTGQNSHAEGFLTTSVGQGSHSEGNSTTSIGITSHAQNNYTIALGNYSHAGGVSSISSGTTSFVHGTNSLARGNDTIVFGANITGTSNNTVYVPYLNVKFINTGTSVNTLGIDSSGNVVTASTTSVDTYVTGFTYSNNNLTIQQNQGQSPLSVNVNTMTGLTINGNLSVDTITDVQSLGFDTTYTGSTGVGQITWNTDFGVPQVGMVGGNVVGKLGESVYAYVKNVDTTPLSKGEVVYIFGASGDKMSVKRASASGDTTSSKTLGIVAESISVNGLGYIITQGTLDGLNLGSYTAGDIVWLSTTPGEFTKVKQYAPVHLVFIGVVQRANNGNGQLYVKPQNGYELDELHNVVATGATNGDLIVYNSGTTMWESTKTLTGNYNVNGTLSATTINGNGSNLTGIPRQGSFGITIDGGGSAITTGIKGYVEIPYDCTITGWTITSDVTGSCVVDVWKDTYGNFPPTSADTITGTEKPTLSSTNKNQDNNLTSWTTSLVAGDIIAFNVDSASTVTRVNLSIRVNKLS